MYKQDMVSRNDLLTAQVALADTEQQTIKAGNGLDLSRAAFNRLLGRDGYCRGSGLIQYLKTLRINQTPSFSGK